MGGVEYNALVSLLTGPIGKALSLLIGVVGLWQIFVSQQTSRGVMMIVGGILMLYLPGIMGTTMAMLNESIVILTGSGIPGAPN